MQLEKVFSSDFYLGPFCVQTVRRPVVASIIYSFLSEHLKKQQFFYIIIKMTNALNTIDKYKTFRILF